MQEYILTADRMPVKAWRWLRVNEAKHTLAAPGEGKKAPKGEVIASNKIAVEQDFLTPAWAAETTGQYVSGELGAFFQKNANRRHLIRIPEDHVEAEPVSLVLHLDEASPVLTDDIVIEAEPGSSATVVLSYTSKPGAKAAHCGRIRVLVRENASIKLVKVQMLANDALHSDAVGVLVEKGAQLQVVLAEIGAANPLSGCNLILAGEGASAELDIVYLGDGQRSLDIACRTEHRGRKTVSNISGKGILLDKSKKVFRDTLDFISGASGSKGREEESVLMLGADVRNISVPLLLCGEDNVEGEHAATSGRPDEKTLFYLMSRGISAEEAKKLLAEAAIAQALEKIPDEAIREAILHTVRKSIEGEGKTA